MQNFMKTILSALQTWTKGKIKDSTADWNQNDSSADSYVKNRTHWEEEVAKEIVQTDVTFEYVEDWDTSWACICDGDTIAIGCEYIVTWDGVEYRCIGIDTDGTPYIGNSDIWWYGSGYENNGMPFCIHEYGGELWCGIYNPSEEETHTISISTTETVVHTLDPKYLDLPENLATTDDVQGAIDAANAAQTTADTAIANANAAQTTANTAVANAATAQSTADGKMDAANPVGTGSFSMNRQADTTIGAYSCAVGCGVTACGTCTHTEGRYNQEKYIITSTDNAVTNMASSNLSGYVLSSVTFDSDKGYFIVGSVSYTSALTSGTAYINNTGAITYLDDGTRTVSSYCIYRGRKSYTLSGVTRYSHTYTIFAPAADVYAHIVGNGTSDTARSNAHTLDWNGVGWYQGGLQVGGNAQDDGAKNVLLEGDAIPVPATAEVGQVLSVKAVDESGVPTEWEAVNMASGGSGESVDLSGYYTKTEVDSTFESYYTKTEIDAIMGSYITDIDTLLGGDS